MRRTALCILALLAPSLMFGQAAAPNPTFDAASVKRSLPGTSGGGITPRPTGLTGNNVTLLFCIRIAYNVQDYQVSGPAWLSTEEYDIEAQTDAPVSQDQLRLMLRTLLAERFGLALHSEERTQSVYTLVVAKNGPKFAEARSDEASGITAEIGHLVFKAATMPALAHRLSQQLHQPVTDLTGLKGTYDFALDWQQDDGDLGASLLSALQEQLGLKLEMQKAPVEVLIVDHAEKIPTPN